MVRSWVRLIWNSLGVAAVAAAAQLAAAQALGIIGWKDHYDAGGRDSWNALLTWIVFIYAVAVLGGAAIGRRAVRRPGRPAGVFPRIVTALAAALGATVAVALAWLPARDAVPPVHVHPELVVAVMAGAGVVAGLVLAIVALFVPPVAGGVRAAVGWIWLAAVGSAIAGIVTHEPYAPPRLAVIDAPSLIPVAWWSGPYVMVAVAAILGFAVAMVARFGGAHRVAVAVSGLAGPLVVAGAYLIAGTVDGTREAGVASFYAAAAGLLASTIVALPGRDLPDQDEADERAAAHDPDWMDADRYRPGNYLADAGPSHAYGSGYRPDHVRTPTSAEPDEPRTDGLRAAADSTHPDQPRWGEPEPLRAPEPVRSGVHHRADGPAAGDSAQSYQGRAQASAGFREFDYPTDEYPTAPPGATDPYQASAPIMGQPPRAFEESQSEWLRTLGAAAPGQRTTPN